MKYQKFKFLGGAVFGTDYTDYTDSLCDYNRFAHISAV